jgi:hypothetical protein
MLALLRNLHPERTGLINRRHYFFWHFWIPRLIPPTLLVLIVFLARILCDEGLDFGIHANFGCLTGRPSRRPTRMARQVGEMPVDCRLDAHAGGHLERACRFTRPVASCPLRVRSANTINPAWKRNPMINTTSPGIGPIAARSHSWSNDLTGVG